MANPAPAIRIESRRLAGKATKRSSTPTVRIRKPRRRRLKIRA